MLRLARDLISLRKQTPDLCTGSYALLPAPAGVWAWRRGDRHAVAINCFDDALTLDDVVGRVRVGTDRARDGENLCGWVQLRGREGLVAEIEPV